MKTFVIGLFISWTALTVSVGAPQICISASTDRDSFYLGEELRPSIVVTNETAASVTLLNPEHAFQKGDLSVTLIGPDKETLMPAIYPPAPLTPKVKDYRTVGKNDHLTWVFPDLVAWYGISKPGKYELQVEYRVKIDGKPATLKSQKLILKFFPQLKTK